MRDITFSSGSEDPYTFSGGNEEGVNATLAIFGNVLNTSTGASITLNNSLNVALLGGAPEGTLWHTVCVLSCSTITVNGVISELPDSGSAGINKNGSGTLVLAGANTFTGGVSVNNGTLLVGNGAALGNGTLKLYDGTSLGVVSGNCITLNNAIALDCSTCTTVTIDLGCSDTLKLTGTISGAAGLVQKGGTLTLSGANTFTGGMEVQNGATLLIGGDSSASPVENTWNICYSPVGLGVLKLDAGATLGAANGGFYSLYNDIALCGSSTVLIDSNCAGLSLYGYISGSGGITKKGDGTLELYNADNDFTGGVTVKRGTLVIGDSSEGNYSEEGHQLLGVTSGPVGTGTLKFETNCTTPVLALADNGCYVLHNAIDLGCFDGTVAIDTGCGDLTLAGYISGRAGITKQGTGSLTLEGDNEFEGDFKIQGGTVNAETDSALGYGTLAFCSANGATVNLDSDCPTISGLSGTNCNDLINLNGNCQPAHLTIDQCIALSYAGKIAGDGKVTKSGGGNLALSGASTFTGGLTIAGGTVTLAGSSHTPDGNVIDTSPVGTGALTINDSSTLSVMGNGVTLLNNVVLYAPGGSGTATQNFSVAEGNSLNIGMNGTSFGAISGDGRLNKTGLGTLTLYGVGTYTGGTSVGGGILAVGNANALGSNAVYLDGGSLRLVNNVTSIPNAINFDTTHGGTLSGNWTFNTAQSFGSGVALSPGNSPGTMTFTAGLTLNNGNTFNVEINGITDAPGTSSDLMDVRNASTHDSYLNVGSLGIHGYTLNIISLDLIGGNVAGAVNGLTGPASWTIFKSDGIVGTFDANNFNLVFTQFSGGGAFALTQVGNDLVLNFTPVPEPSTYALLGLGLGLSGFAAWRKRRRA